MPRSRFSFDRFELLPAQRRLLRDGQPVVLRTKAFDLLVALASRAGELVTKGELLEQVWSGVVVEENNIAAQIVALRKALGANVIETVPGKGYRFIAELREDTAAPAAPAAAVAPIAAAPGRPLHGRDADLARLAAALSGPACVTLVGPGGVGKTALAKAVAAGTTGRKVGWVDLAALGEADPLRGPLERALGVDSRIEGGDDAAIQAALRAGPWLVVLDNAEHVIQPVAALVVRLRALDPALTLLVTSQVPLRIAGETVFPVEPLALPEAEQTDEAALATPAVQLVLERIRAHDPGYAVGTGTVPLLRHLVASLDGLPLALEMAAALVPLLGAQGVLAALDDRFSALRRGQRDAPARHRTLLAAIDWSHDLLEPHARQVFRRLGVFHASFPVDLATAVAGAEADRWDTIDALAELVERSLVTRLAGDPPRYRLLETMRSFALRQLDAAGETAAVRREAVRLLTAALRAAAERGASGAPAAADLDNVPALLAWARLHDRPAALALTVAAAKVATWTPWLGEAVRWVEAGESLLGADIAPAAEAEWWRELARFQTFVRGPRAVEAARRAVDIERRLDNPAGLFWSLVPLLRSRMLAPEEFEALRAQAQALADAHPEWGPRERVVLSGSLAMEYRRRGDFESALVHQRDEAALAQAAGLHEIADNALSNLAATLVGLERHEEALERLDALLARGTGAPTPVGAHHRIQRLNALIGLGRVEEAQAAAPEALHWAERFDALDVLQVLARLAALRGRPRVAARLLGHWRERLRQRGAAPPEDTHAPWRDAQRLVEAALAEPVRTALFEAGARLSPADASLLAARGEEPGISPPAA